MLSLACLGACTPTPSLPTLVASATDVAEIAIPATENAASELPADSLAQIYILAPGPGSVVASPIRLNIQLRGDQESPISVELIDELGRLRFAQIMAYENQLDLGIPFEISRTNETALLRVSTQDEYARLEALSSVPLILLQTGESNIAPSLGQPIIQIEQPAAGQEIPANNLLVEGQVMSDNGGPIHIEAIDRTGKVLAFDDVYLREANNGYGDFSVELNFNVEQQTWVLIVISQSDPVFGLTNFASVEVLISP